MLCVCCFGEKRTFEQRDKEVFPCVLDQRVCILSAFDISWLHLKNKQTNFEANLALLMSCRWLVCLVFFFFRKLFLCLSLSDNLQTQYMFPVLSVIALLHAESYDY